MLSSLLSKSVLRNLNIVSFAVNTLAAAALISSFLKWHTLINIVLWLAAFIWILYLSRTIKQVRSGSYQALGKYPLGRVMLISAALLWLPAPRVVILAAALLLSVLAEPVTSRIIGASHPQLAHFPGVAPSRAPRAGSVIFAMHHVTIALLGLTAATKLTLYPLALLILVSWLLQGACVGFALASIRSRHQNNVASQIERLDPQFLVYWDAPRGASYQISMWLPYWEQIGARFLFVTRTPANFAELRELSHHPVTLRKRLTELDDVITPNVRAVFYVNNAARNTQMIRYHQLHHIQLLHGDSDKASSFNPVLRMYDFNFVAGQAAIDRFARNGISMPADTFKIVGRPQVETITPASGPIADVEQVRVLYAPTWAGFFKDTNYSSLPYGIEIVKALLARGAEVIFRPHPYTGRSPELARIRDEIIELLTSDAARSGRQHLYGSIAETQMSIFDCFNASHALISDVSAVVGDYLFSAKPYAIINVSHELQDFVTDFPMARAAYVWRAKPNVAASQLRGVVEQLLETDPLAETRVQLRNYYLGDFPVQGYAQNFVTAAREVVLGSPEAATDPDSPAPVPTADPAVQ